MIQHLNRKIYSRIVIAGFLLSLSTPSGAETEIVHQQGTRSFQSPPQRVVTFDLASLDTLDALDVPVVGVPKAFLPPYLDRYRKDDIENVGSLFEPDFEKVARMGPDLVIVASRSSPAYDLLDQIAPTIDMTVWGEGFLAQFKDRVSSLARLFDRVEPAEVRLAAIDQRIADIRQRAADAGSALVILTNGGKLSAYGPGSRFGIIHDEFGFEPAMDDIRTAVHGDPVSFEFILQQDPEWLFVVDRDSVVGAGASSARATLDNELIHQTRAFRNDRIVYLDTLQWYLIANGLRSVETMLDDVLSAIQ